ncbi:hypothetical protein K3495_g1399 [Podosphaera aphanis]|nr:hypothetical protein K3495_g1399 [Podosphaera aphanis]
MKQGEAQIFRQFLQEWELQFEYAGGHEWPEKLKVKRLRRSISEKLLDKIDVLKLPKDNYHDWVEAVAEVASNMEKRGYFVGNNESQVTQYTTRSRVAQCNDTSSGSSPPDKSQPILPESLIDHDGDVTMGGMKIDVNQLSAFIASLNSKGKGKVNGKIRNAEPKPSAPWRSDEEVQILHEKKVCIRCEKSGHIKILPKVWSPEAIHPN